jgi:hypothetical protein
VALLLRCSGRWARDLTEAARYATKAERDGEIVRLRDEGKTVRAVAQGTGVSVRTVHDVQNRKTAVSEQPDPGFEPYPPPPGFLTEAAKEKLRELDSPPAENWAAALRALRHINEQELFADRYRRRTWHGYPLQPRSSLRSARPRATCRSF